MSETTNPGVERFRRMLAAESWANALSIESLRSVPHAARGGEEYVRAMQLLPHNQLAREVWLARLTSRTFPRPSDWFPAWVLEETAAACARNDAAWGEYLASLADADLAREIDFVSSEGQTFRSRIDDVITHVFQHSAYHRGQLARIVSRCGGQRASTDYIGFTRVRL